MNGFVLTITLTLGMVWCVSCTGVPSSGGLEGSKVLKCVKCNPCDGTGPKAVKCSPEELLPYFHYRSCVKIVNNDTTTNIHGVVNVEKRCSTKLPSTDTTCIMNPFGVTPGVLECKYYCGHDGCNSAPTVLAPPLRRLWVVFGLTLSTICQRWRYS